VAGQFAATDALRGVFKTPAGVGTRLAGALALETKFTNADLELLNSSQVNSIRHMPGAGIAIMGGRTLRNTADDRYISVRRSLIYVRRALLDATQFAIFEVNDSRLWSALQTNIEQFLLEFWQLGGLRGGSSSAAFYVKCDEETNPPTAIANGEVRVEVGVALQTPAEFVIIRIAQFNGGSRATEGITA
jgi:phage tail sheath protein FI